MDADPTEREKRKRRRLAAWESLRAEAGSDSEAGTEERHVKAGRHIAADGSPAPKGRNAGLLLAALTLALTLALVPSATAAPPTVAVNTVTERTLTTAKVSATIDATASEEVSWCFEFSPAGKAEWNIDFDTCGPSVPAGVSEKAEGKIDNLVAATSYEARLLYESPPGSGPLFSAPTAPFETDTPANVPTLTAPQAEGVSLTTATLKGAVNPNGGNVDLGVEPNGAALPILWQLQYSAEPSNPGAWQFGGGNTINPGEGAESSDPIDVEAPLSGLIAGTEYATRLLVTYAGITEETDGDSFETAAAVAPTLTVEPPQAVGATVAIVKGTVNPNGGNTDAHSGLLPLSWSIQTRHEPSEGWSDLSGGTFGGEEAESTDPIGVEAKLSHLEFSKTYEWRLHVVYAGDSADEAGATFETEAVTKPVVSIEAPVAIDVDEGTYRLSGHITPGGTDPGFATEWHFECKPGCGTPGGTLPADNSSHEVKAKVNLEPSVTYEITLRATNAAGEEKAETSFGTGGAKPRIAAQASTSEGPGEATIRAFVTPRNSPVTECVFLYGPTEAYGQEAPCQEHPGDEIQQLKIAASSGQFTLGFEGQTTSELPFDATAGEVQATLEALSTIGSGSVSVSAAALTGPTSAERYRITFQGVLGQKNVEELTIQEGTPPLSNGESNVVRELTTLNGGGLNVPSSVTATLTGLQPGATYHYALKATNAIGTKTGPDWEFEVQAEPEEEGCPNAALRSENSSKRLPDCRAYEMVSPPEKNGGDVSPDSSRTRAARDLAPGEPMAIQFTSHTGLGDAAGGGISIDYMAIRDAQPATQGWSTHAITPQQNPMPLRSAANQDPAYDGDFSPDLSTGVFRAFSPLTDEDPNVANVENLYLRNDLRSPGAGSYQLLTPCPGCTAPLANTFFQSGSDQDPRFVGASADFSHVIFESAYGLTADAPGCSSDPSARCPRRLYEWEGGSIRPAAVLPDGSVPTQSTGGSGMRFPNTYVFNAISADGRKVFFTDNTTNSSGNGGDGNLYMRLDHTSTVLLNASERTDCADHDLCSGAPEPAPNGQSPATYEGASTDGSRVFFTSEEALTDDAVRSGRELYMYDTTKPASDPHNLTLISHDPTTEGLGANVVGMLGRSDDGHWVYFVNRGQLVAGAPEVEAGIFLWHDGTLRYLGAFTGGQNGFAPGDLIGLNVGETFAKPSRVSLDGRHLLVATVADPVLGSAGYDHGECSASNACVELYLYDVDSGSFDCVSCNPNGVPATADARDTVGERQTDGRGPAHNTNHLNNPMTADGGRVFFSTAQALVPEDTNGVEDAYEYDAASGEVSLLSSGTDSHPSYFEEATPDGKDVFIRTAEQLVGWDHDNNYDLYDVRIGGGFPEPAPVPSPCSGDNCRLSPASSQGSAAGTASFQGPGNYKPKRQRPHHRKCKQKKKCHKSKANRRPHNHRGGVK